MKKFTISTIHAIFFFSSLFWGGSGGKVFSQNIGINTTGATAAASALLDVSSTNAGVLIPRVSLTSTTDVTTIASPANYLTVYNTNAAMTNGNGKGMYYYNGTAWVYLVAPSNGPGTSGQVVTSQGAGSNPQWVTPTTSSSGCNGADWTCVAVASSGAVANFGTYASSYTVSANKEVLVVIEANFSGFTPAITDLVSVDQIDVQTSSQIYSPLLIWYSPQVPNGASLPDNFTADYTIIHGHKNKSASTSTLAITITSFDNMSAAVLINGTGAISLYDNDTGRSFALYIFER